MLEFVNADKPVPGFWHLSKILEHCKVGQKYKVHILWENGETSWEPLGM